MITIDDSSAGQRVQSRPRDEKKQSTEATNVGKKTAPMDTSLEPPAPPSTKATASGTPTQGGGASTSASTNNPPATNTTTGEDIYEFKSVKESTSPTDTTKSTDPEPQSEDPLNATNPPEEPSSNNKRTFNDLTDPDTNEPNDEDSRRKKRKDSDSGKTNSQPTRNPNQSNKISAKPNALKPNSIERKSPIPSPKSSTSTAADQDDDAKPDLKVPPLKIVIPQSSTTGEQETGGNRNGKSSSQRAHHAALPYVVPSSNDATGTPGDKEQTNNPVGVNTVGNEGSGGSVGQGTGGAPGASTAGKDDKKEAVGAAGDDQKSSGHHQRVLRSSHRSAGGGTTGGGQPTNSTTTDRSSNNSSPLLQQRSHSPSPNSSPAASTSTTSTVPTSTASGPSNPAQPEQNRDPPPAQATTVKTTPNEPQTSTNTTDTDSNGSSTAAPTAVPAQSGNTTAASTTNPTNVELHPRKRKMRPNKEQTAQSSSTQNDGSSSSSSTSSGTGPEKGPGNGNNTSGSADSTAAADVHPHDQPITNCYQLFLNIRKQIERRRKSLFPVQPKPPQGFKDYLMNRCTYVLAGTAPTVPNINPPTSLPAQMRDIFGEQERERYRLRMQHVIEKEKLVLSVEQEILRVHGRAARALANQSLPFSVCTVLRDDEVYNIITPEQEEKDRNARSRYNGRLFLSWLQDVDDKWEKIKEHMLLRHHNEAESLHAVQKMDWEWKLKELSLCEYKATPQIDEVHVPMVHVSDDFDLLPA